MPEIARDSQTGALIKACDASKKSTFVCLCPDKHAVFLRKGMERAAHFAHYSVEEGGGAVLGCRGGGESEEHIEAKHRLVEMQGQYKFALRTCTECYENVWEECAGKLDIEARSMDRRWRYDVLLTRSDQTQLALEVYHTHATSEEKVESSALIGVPIAEFRAQDILDLQPGGVLHNLQCVEWICGEACLDRKRRQEAAREKKLREEQEAMRNAREKKLREEQEAAMNRVREQEFRDWCARERRVREQEEADRIACVKKNQREKQEEARRVDEIESNKRRKLDKLYYHCKFNGVNNTCYWAPLAKGVLTYGELVAKIV
jgi:hypothetical protein